MSLLDTVMDTVSGKTGTTPQTNPLVGLIGNIFTQSGGLQGMMTKFNQAGLGGVFSSWVGTGQNQPITSEQIQQILGSDQVKALAGQLGMDPAQISRLMAEQLPKVVDKLTPEGKIDPKTNIQQSLSGLLPSLLQTLGPKLASLAQR